jgi:competence protein ComEC
MERFRKYLPYVLCCMLLVCAVSVWFLVYRQEHMQRYLTVVFLDIGQGDSIYIEAPNGRQMLIDGGPDQTVLRELSTVMPFGDRSIDIVLATHADADHIGGLPFVIDRYTVSDVIENGARATTKTFQALQTQIEKHHIQKYLARAGMHIVLDKRRNIYFDILFPDRDVSSFTEANDGSIVGKLVYGTQSFMLTGDATMYTENLIMQKQPAEVLHSQVLKLGHHGSHTSSSVLWLKNVHPDIAIISAGLHNRYGHPHKEVVDRLDNFHIPYLVTYEKGTIVFKTNGMKLWQ